MAQNTTIPVKVGVVLDLDTWVGKMGLSCISMALSDFYASHGHYKTRVVTNIRDSKRDVVGAAAVAVDLLQNEEVEAIIGPGSSIKARVPIISFSATSPSLSSLQTQVPTIRAIVQAFGWREVVLIYVDNDALLEVDAHVTYWSPIHPSVTDDHLVEELHKLMRMPSRVFIVHMLTPLAYRLFTKANEAGMMEEGYMEKKIQEEYPTNEISELNIFGFWAYDAACALAMAVEKLGAGNFSLEKTNISRDSTSFERVGFWTPENGIVRRSNSTSKANLRAITWPGESPSVPKDPITNTTKITGYSIAIFENVMETLPYAVPYEYVPSRHLMERLLKYDAVVGDTTILANRSFYVDFTLPYTESGVSMIVPPLTWDLWVTSACFFVFIGFVIWTLEHRINEDFRGPRSHQVGTIFWFSFSTLVFAQSNFSSTSLNLNAQYIYQLGSVRDDHMVFVVLILTLSYTASFTSMLTVQQLKPTITDINELIRTGQCVGYQNGSFIFSFLKRMKLGESSLVKYDSPEQLNELFSSGRRKGGIAAAFDEIPCMKLFLTKYCPKYTTFQLTYKLDGFGFVFPKHSPLVSDVSMRILHLTEGDQTAKFEKVWFEQNSSCLGLNSSLSSDSIGVDSFGAYSLLLEWLHLQLSSYACTIGPPTPVWRKLKPWQPALITRTSAPILSEKVKWERNGINGMDAVTASPATNYPPSPSSLSVQTHSNFAFSRPASEYGDPMSPNGQTSPETAFGIELAN
ncbi:hypothetical protein AAG906_017247 [Vitis piasezkii]